jgi:light-regulated signal transduction histidine kinase (bacteriophytochrome)
MNENPPSGPAPTPAGPAPVTLENCDREPIHLPGSIQPHGALIAFEPTSAQVLHASANLEYWLAAAAGPARGQTLAGLLGPGAGAQIERARALTTDGPVRHEVIDLPARPQAGQPLALEAVVHVHRGIGFVELEAACPPERQHEWMKLFGDRTDALYSSDDLEDLARRTAQRVKLVTRFDRVMVYRFDADWNGHVIAEACEPGMESFLDLHYPASDIPVQARELYRTNLVRYIADIGYAPVPVQPWLEGTDLPPLDMSHAQLRSVSPIHVQYLRNMGVGATLTISLLVGERLWGLIACHHRTPAALPVRLRQACHALGVSAGHMVGWTEHREQGAAWAARVQTRDRVVQACAELQVPLAEVIRRSGADLLRLVDASGGAFWHADGLLPFGHWPGPAQGEAILALVRQALATAEEDIYSSARALLAAVPDAREPDPVCGVLALGLDPEAGAGIVWIRPEVRREVSWGGDPDKPVQIEIDAQGQPRLSPRSSFARWLTVVQGSCRAWTAMDLRAARLLQALQPLLQVRATLAELGQKERQLRSLVALQSDAYFQLDLQGRILTVSRPLPFGPEPAAGQSLPAWLASGCDAAGVQALARALQGGQPFRDLRVHGQAEDGAWVLRVNADPLVNQHGHPTGWQGTIAALAPVPARQP